MKKYRFFVILLLLGMTLWGSNSKDCDGAIQAGYIDQPPQIDGKIDEVYDLFTQVDQFYQMDTGWGEEAEEKTVIYLGYDQANLYLAARCFKSETGEVRANIGKREDLENSDMIVFFLDTFYTRRRALFFGFNPYGIQVDGTRDDEKRGHNMDFSWDTLWDSQGRIYDWGYFVEARIPFKSIRFPGGKNFQKWGFIAERLLAGKGEKNASVRISRDIRGYLSQAAPLIIDNEIKSGKNLEIIPTITGAATESEKMSPEFGASFKYGITSNSTFDVTYNPDYSQIEADSGRIDINQRYALQYPEKRSFFLESRDIFEMPMNLFYSRRIANPQWGLKFTGKFGKSDIGWISARDHSSYESVWDVSEGGESHATAHVLRYKYNLKESNYIGIFASQKTWDGKQNLTLSLDSFLKFKNFAFTFQSALTSGADTIGADEETIAADSIVNNVTGNSLLTTFSYNGKHVNSGLGYAQYSPSYDPQLGFQRRVNYRTYWLYAGYNLYPQKEYLRNLTPRLMVTQNFDWETGEEVDRKLTFSLWGASFKGSSFSARVQKEYEKYEGVGFDKLKFSFFYEIDLTKFLSLGSNFRLGDSVDYSEDPYLGYSYSLSLWSGINILKRINIRANYDNYYFYDKPGGQLEYKMNIFRLRKTILFTRRLSSRMVYEYNDYYLTQYLSLLLSYELNPGTVFYLGATSGYLREEAQYMRDNYSVFFKFSYFLRV